MNYKHQLHEGYKFPYRSSKDLSSIELSGDDKLHIVMTADSSEVGDVGVAKQHKLDKKTISRWRYLLNTNGFLHGPVFSHTGTATLEVLGNGNPH